MGNKKQFTDDEIKTMVKLYNEEFESTTNIALRFNVDSSVITSRLRNLGIAIPKGSAYSKQYWIDRGKTESEAIEHIKTIRPSNKSYWINKGYSEEDAESKLEGQRLVSLKGCISRFGEIEGAKVWEDRKLKRIEWSKLGSANIQYWLNKGYSEEEAHIKRSERQSTFSLKTCIKKYGEEEGLKRFTERQLKWVKSLSTGGNLKIGYSKISQELFNILLNSYDVNNKNDVYFGTNKNEFRLEKENGGLWLYDFTDIKNKKIIEYNGDMYHGNPKKYKSTDYPHPFRKTITAQEMWDNDIEKIRVANKNGYEVLTIWDSEYRWGNKQEIINKCKKFLNLK